MSSCAKTCTEGHTLTTHDKFWEQMEQLSGRHESGSALNKGSTFDKWRWMIVHPSQEPGLGSGLKT